MRIAISSIALIIAIVLAGCNQNTSPVAQQQAATPTVATAPSAPAPAPIPPNTELPLQTVDSVMLSRPADAQDALDIRVSGTALSPGWTAPKLAPVQDTSGDTSIKTLRLVATSPRGNTSGPSQPIQIEMRLDALSPDVKTIRIISATNEVSAPISTP